MKLTGPDLKTSLLLDCSAARIFSNIPYQIDAVMICIFFFFPFRDDNDNENDREILWLSGGI
jgi:hypothetical protein